MTERDDGKKTEYNTASETEKIQDTGRQRDQRRSTRQRGISDWYLALQLSVQVLPAIR